LSKERFVWQKFRAFIEEFLPEQFWERPDELHPNRYGVPPIKKDVLRRFLAQTYDARSKFAHAGKPFPAYVEIGISDRVDVAAAMQAMALIGSTKFVPPFVWFERLTHLVLREYLLRVIPRNIAERRGTAAES